MESHRLRLMGAGLVERLVLRQGQEALVWATTRGAQAAGVGAPGLRRVPAPSTWEHHLAVGWAAAFFTVQRRALLGGREVLADDRWSSEIGWAEHAGYRQSRHRPDLVTHDAQGRRLAVEVELTAKSRARTRAVLDMYAYSRAVDRVTYLVADELVARHIDRCRERSMLAPDRLVVAGLAGVREQARSAPRERFSPPAPVEYAVRVSEGEIEAQRAVERHQAARRPEREEEEERRAAEQEQRERAAAVGRRTVAPVAGQSVDELLEQFSGQEPVVSRRRRWGR